MRQRFENKFDLLKAAYQDENLKKSAVALLQYLVHKSNREQCFPAVETIAKAMNVCKRTVQYNMRKLERAGYIIRKDRYYNHQQLSNQYIFNLGVLDITEGENKQNIYTDNEKEALNDFLFTNLGKNPAPDMDKSKEILKIYNMNLSKYEKLLLIYLLHKADKYAFVYEDMRTYMKAIGVCHTTMIRLLHGLRKKGLILVKSMKLGDKELLAIKLTRIIYTNPETLDDEEMTKTEKQEITKTVKQEIIENVSKNIQSYPDDPNQESGYFYAHCTRETGTGHRKNPFTALGLKLKEKIYRILASVFLRQ